MSNKIRNTASKSSCDRLSRQSWCCANSEKSYQKGTIPKKVIVSKKLASISSSDNKSCSTGVLSNTKKLAIHKLKKTARSEVSLNRKLNTNKYLDYCKQCGDAANSIAVNKDPLTTSKGSVIASTKNKSITKEKAPNSYKHRLESVKQYYKNENFKGTESVEDIASHFKKISLDTIKEVPEARTVSNDSIFRIYSSSESDDNDYLDTSNGDIKKLKQFRQQNYFECHSAKSRIKNRASVISLQNHQCVYRFYLNDRLFPVPLNTDYNGKVRCVECHLPMDMKENSEKEKINGTIQAKVKLGADLKDIILLLPAKEPLIIKQKRTEPESVREVVYFGVIKLSSNGNSIFNETLPNNSLGLKYQKGYKEFESKNGYTYKKVEENDVIVI